MIWNEITIETNSWTAEAIGGILMSLGIDSWESMDDSPILDPYAKKIYEELQPNSISMEGKCITKFYLDQTENPTLFKSIILKKWDEIFGEEEPIKISLGNSDESLWKDKWKDYFHSFSIDYVFIKPSWETDTIVPDDAKTIIKIDPGMSFGSGTHETTKLCIRGLIESDLKDKKIMDLGCGSGILSIVCLLRGANHVTGIDIDPDAIISSKENLLNNKCNDADYLLFAGDLSSDKDLDSKIEDNSFDIIVTNILADIIIELLPAMTKKLKKGGKIIASGIIDFKEKDVCNAFEDAGITVTDRKEDGEWRAVYGILS